MVSKTPLGLKLCFREPCAGQETALSSLRWFQCSGVAQSVASWEFDSLTALHSLHSTCAKLEVTWCTSFLSPVACPDPAHAHILRGETAPDHIGLAAADPLQDVSDGDIRNSQGQELPGAVHVAAETLQTRYVFVTADWRRTSGVSMHSLTWPSCSSLQDLQLTCNLANCPTLQWNAHVYISSMLEF